MVIKPQVEGKALTGQHQGLWLALLATCVVTLLLAEPRLKHFLPARDRLLSECLLLTAENYGAVKMLGKETHKT